MMKMMKPENIFIQIILLHIENMGFKINKVNHFVWLVCSTLIM